MMIRMEVMSEDSRSSGGKEYCSITGREVGTKTPLLQFLDYSIRDEEKQHRGKLVGKTVEIHVEQIRAIFAGRPQLTGKILNPDVK